jgi:hypothetical protein
MGAKHLSQRDNWQKGAKIVGDKGENKFISALAAALPNHYDIKAKPRDLLKIYNGEYGIIPDSKITNTKTGKCLFIEKKTGNNDGNAHERVYKFLSKPLQKKVSKEFNAINKPFFTVFSGDTFQKDKYKNEISLLLKGENYAIMDNDFENIQQVAAQIVSIL